MDDASSFSSSSESEVLVGSSGSDLINTHPTSASVMGKMILFGERDGNESEEAVWAVTRRSFAVMSNETNSGSDSSGGLLDAAASVAASIVSGMVEINNTQGEAGHMGDAVGDDMNDTLAMGPPPHWPVRDPLYITIPITVIYVIILILGLLGNVTTCIVIIRSRYLHTTTNYYLFSLAVSDLLLLLSGLPAEMHSIWRRYPGKWNSTFFSYANEIRKPKFPYKQHSCPSLFVTFLHSFYVLLKMFSEKFFVSDEEWQLKLQATRQFLQSPLLP